MGGKTPITLAAARYSDREGAVDDFHTVWDADEPSITPPSPWSPRTDRSLQVEGDGTAKHLAWGGALLGAASLSSLSRGRRHARS
jgi:hypothetical protein